MDPNLNTMLDGVPGLGVIVLVAAVVIGLGLWLTGRKLARPACVLGGALAGALLGLAISEALGAERSIPVYLVVAAILGGLMAAFLFRFWMALSLALLLGLVAPAASLVWMGASPPEAAQAPTSVEDLMIDTSSSDAAQRSIEDIWQKLQGVYRQQFDLIASWWQSLASRGRNIVIVAATLGLAVGLAIGLLRPYLAASIQSAFVGGGLWLAGGRSLLAIYLPDQTAWLPVGLRAWLLALAVVTAVGILIQTWLWRRRTT